MPRLSDSMEEGTIVRWLKQDGDLVSKGEPLAEVETDKATVTFDADADGTLRILAGEGADRADRGSDREHRRRDPSRTRVSGARRVRSRRGPRRRGQASDAGNGADRVRRRRWPVGSRASRRSTCARSPVGSGRPDRQSRPRRRSPDAPEPRRASAKGVVTTVQPSRTQVQIAQRMAESKATIPDFTLHAEADMEQAVAAAGAAAPGRARRRGRPVLQRHGRQGVRARAARPSAGQRGVPRRRVRAATSESTSGSRSPPRTA